MARTNADKRKPAAKKAGAGAGAGAKKAGAGVKKAGAGAGAGAKKAGAKKAGAKAEANTTKTVLETIDQIKILLILIQRKVINGYSLLANETVTINNCKIIQNEKNIELRQKLGEARATCIENLRLIVKKLYSKELRQKFSKAVSKIVMMSHTAKNFKTDPNDKNSVLNMRVAYLARNGALNTTLQRVNSCSIETLFKVCESSSMNEQLDLPLLGEITPSVSAQASPRTLASEQYSQIFTDEEIRFLLKVLF